MAQQSTDWKDIASSYYDKCMALTIIFVLFTFIVFPNIETQSIRSVERVMEVIIIPPDIPEQIKPPEEVPRPIVNIEIVDPDSEDDDDDIIIIPTIGATALSTWEDIAPPVGNTFGETPKFVAYEDAPVILRRVNPTYPDMARRMGIQGTVLLDVEVLSDGTIGAIEVLQSVQPGPGGLDEAAINAVRQFQIQPAKSGGNSVACWIRLPINFTF